MGELKNGALERQFGALFLRILSGCKLLFLRCLFFLRTGLVNVSLRLK